MRRDGTMLETVYKFVGVDGYGCLRSALTAGEWSLLYEIGRCAVPRDPASLLFAYRQIEDALESCCSDLVERSVQLYEATTSRLVEVPECLPLLADVPGWHDYWQWHQRGMLPQLRNTAWKLYHPSPQIVLCRDVTLTRHGCLGSMDGNQEQPLLDAQDHRELEALHRQLLSIEQSIARLEVCDPILDELSRHFHLGMVGGSGRGTAALNARRERSLDKSIATGKKLVPLYQEHARLIARIADITSGRRQQERARETRREQARRAMQERIRSAEPGTSVIDSAFGPVRVVRRNRKSLTIETESGYREARPFDLILSVVDEEMRGE